MFTLSSLLASSSSYKCPGSPSWIHASCKTQVKAQASCADVKTEMMARINGQYAQWHDPHNNGTYSIVDSSNSNTLSLKRKTGDKKYTDKINFYFQDADTSCSVYGCSESQIYSVLDFSTNYCNMFSLYCGTAQGCKVVGKDISIDEKSVSPSTGASSSKKDCLKLAARQETSRRLFAGGTRPVEVSEQVRELVSEVKGEFEKQRSLKACPMCMHVESVETFEPVQVMKQVVAGINYFVKVRIADDEYAFLRIYDRFGSVSLTSIQLGKTKEDQIEYFE